MNPWKLQKLEFVRKVILFFVWALVAVNLIFAAVFLIFFSFNFFVQFWDYLKRLIFTEPW